MCLLYQYYFLDYPLPFPYPGMETIVPETEKLYSWWSYRNQDWRKSNRGRRLDHMWVTPDLVDKAVSHRIVQPARSWERPSDHIPLITEFAF